MHTSFASLRKDAFGTFWQACPCLRHACGTLAACLSMQACTSMHLEPFGKLVHACACLRFRLTWLCLEKGMLAQACTCLLQACPSATLTYMHVTASLNTEPKLQKKQIYKVFVH